MKTFHCDSCGALVYFENVSCLQCGHVLGFLPDAMDLAALEPDADPLWKSLAPDAPGRLYRACANRKNFAVCNWFVPAEDTDEFCTACRLNDTIPDTSRMDNLRLWRKVESAKRRLIYTLRRLRLTTEGFQERSWPRMRFRFLAEAPGDPAILTGHERGLITLNIAEADDVERERRRTLFMEPQRTLVGHFRHEAGHYYWDGLIANSPWRERFRSLFGNETGDYAGALRAYYANGPARDWENRCVSAYASAHPWEDWAETWAHYLNMVDTVEMAASFDLLPRAREAGQAEPDWLAATAPGGKFETLLDHWLPITYAVNSLNRSSGLPDLYPFVLSNPALEKLRFVHEVVAREQPQ